MNFKNAFSLVKETFQDWSEDKAPRLAAALSYYTIFALAPLLVLIIAITGFVIGNNDAIRSQLLTQVQGLVGQQGAQAVDTLITNASKPRSGIIATVLGIITLVLGATGVFGQLQDALNTIWEVEPKKGGGILRMIKDRFLSFTMVLGTAFLLLVSLVISTALSFINHYFSTLFGGLAIIAQITNFVISLGVVTLIFGLIFKVLPDVKIAWRDVWIGALVTALLFSIGRALISLYLGSTSASSAYGAAGSLVILLLWVYYSAQILFMGAEFTQVYARRSGSRIVPSENARPVTESERAQQGTPRTRKQGALENPGQTAGQSVSQAMVPVTSQPEIHPALEREKIRYAPPNTKAVVPVIAAGAAASLLAVLRAVRMLKE